MAAPEIDRLIQVLSACRASAPLGGARRSLIKKKESALPSLIDAPRAPLITCAPVRNAATRWY
jgi:hypothetical protein